LANRILIFANGELQDGTAVRRALQYPSFVIAADGGAHLARQMGQAVHLLIGDMDSIESDLLHDLQKNGCELMRFPAEKDETDLELALLEAAKRGADWVRIIGALGGRLDQMLANVHLLNLPDLQGVDVRLVANQQSTWVINAGEHPLMGEAGDTISLLPLGESAAGISTYGLQYPLRDETLHYGSARGISNVIQEAGARLTLREGRLLVVHTIGRA
jgi:thiamine pyrophosphokinase